MQRKGHTPSDSQKCHGTCILALLPASFCHSHAGKHKQDLANASYYYHSHGSVASLQIFSQVFISGRDYVLWVAPVTLAQCHQYICRFRENTAGRNAENSSNPAQRYLCDSFQMLPNLVFKKNYGATTTSLGYNFSYSPKTLPLQSSLLCI